MKLPENLPDWPHVEQLRHRLWQDAGRAAVLVGAGFSRNAEPAVTRPKPMPLWSDLGRRMYDALYPPAATAAADLEGRKADIAARTAGGNLLELATEHEATFGRAALEQLVSDAVPDLDYEPGELHRLLLALPWADVLTTNYDTLLERTARRVVERRYDTVVVPEDLGNARPPRVVKLHGTLPSTRPLVLTQEDYRTYPRRMAPFVNLARQAASENALLLLGFGGDDPNFLEWSGWVTDEMGEHRPRVYLAGLLGLSPSRRRLLDGRRVTPIDLSPLFPSIEYPDLAQRHRKATHWLLYHLLLGVPWAESVWPHRRRAIYIGDYKCPMEVAKVGDPEDQPVHLKVATVADVAELRKLRDYWREQRQRYPGWRLAPRGVRESLRSSTIHEYRQVITSLAKLEPPDDLLLLRELLWRLDLCLVPLDSDGEAAAEEVVRRYNPHPLLLTSHAASIGGVDPRHEALRWAEIRVAWFDAVLALHREARESWNVERAAEHAQWLEAAVTEAAADQTDAWRHEQILGLLTRLDLQAAGESAEAWRPATAFGAVLRAGTLMESGRAATGTEAAEEALDRVRSSQRPGRRRASDACEEVLALAVVEHSHRHDFLSRSEDERRDEGFYGPMWDVAGRFALHEEFDHLKATLAVDADPDASEEASFDPGRVSRRRRSKLGGFDETLFSGIALVRAAERCGLPLGWIGRSQKQAISKLALALQPFGVRLACSATCRAGVEGREALGIVLDRTTAATIPEDEAVKLAGAAESATRVALGLKILGGTSAFPLNSNIAADGLLELLSRLAFRLPLEHLRRLLELACEIEYHDDLRTTTATAGALDSLFSRLIFAWPSEAADILLLRLLERRVPPAAQALGRLERQREEPLLVLSAKRGLGLADATRDAVNKSVDALVTVIKEDNVGRRAVALGRLFGLDRLGVLKPDRRRAASAAIWSQRDEDHLPKNLGFWYRASVLSLPVPDDVNAHEVFVEKFLRQPLATLTSRETDAEGKGRVSVAMGSRPTLGELLLASRNGMHWTAEEAAQMVARLAEWWQAEEQGRAMAKAPSPFSIFATAGFDDGAAQAVELLACVALPKLSDEDRASAQAAEKLLEEMNGEGIDTNPSRVRLLRLQPGLAENVAVRVRRGLFGRVAGDVGLAHRAVGMWHRDLRNGISMPPPPGDLLNTVANFVAARRLPSLYPAMLLLGDLIRKTPAELTDERLRLIVVGLERLLEELRLRRWGDDVLDTLPRNEIPRHRAAAAGLAASVAQALTGQGESIPSSVQAWLNAAANDPLPEVRRALAGDKDEE